MCPPRPIGYRNTDKLQSRHIDNQQVGPPHTHSRSLQTTRDGCHVAVVNVPPGIKSFKDDENDEASVFWGQTVCWLVRGIPLDSERAWPLQMAHLTVNDSENDHRLSNGEEVVSSC